MPRTKRPSLLEEYVRVTKECPCPRCGRPDWCLLHKSGHSGICSREKSDKPRGDAGWYYKVTDAKRVKKIPTQTEKVYLTPKQVAEYLQRLPPATEMLDQQAYRMGLSLDSLIQLYARYDSEKAVVAFPMLNAKRESIGVRFRRADGRKWSLKGGREGVFVSRSFRPDKPVFIAEGPTDAATLIECGFPNVLGRPNCSGGTTIIRVLLVNNRTTPVVVLADPGEPGEHGAANLANALPNPTIVIRGPEDIRDYYIYTTKATKKLTLTLKAAIIESLDSLEQTAFVTIHRNQTGQFTNFMRYVA